MNNLPASQHQEPNQKDQVLLDGLRFLKKEILSRWVLLVFFSVTFAGLGLTYAIIKRPRYIAQTSMILETNAGSKSAMASYLDAAKQFGLIAGGGAVIDEEKILDLFKSRKIISGALLETAVVAGKPDLLANHYLEIFKLRPLLDKHETLTGFKFGDKVKKNQSFYEDSIMGLEYLHLKDLMEIEKNNKSGVIKVSIKTPSEDFSRWFCNYLIESATEFYLLNKTQRDQERVESLQNRADSVETELMKGEKELTRLQDANTKMVKFQGYLEEIDLKRKVQILNILFVEVTKNLEFAKFNLLSSAPLVQIIDSPVLPLEVEEPNPVFFTLGGLLLGLFSGIGLAYFVYFIKTIKNQLAEARSMEAADSN